MKNHRRTTLIRPALLAITLGACATGDVKVTNVWFDHSAGFASLHTFAVKPIETTVEVDDFLANGIADAIREHLTKRGYTEQAEAPDFVVVTSLEATARYLGAPVHRERGGEVSFSIEQNGREIWRSSGSALAPDKTSQRTERIREAVDTTLMRFPPKPEDY